MDSIKDNKMNFTTDWFSFNIPNMELCMKTLNNKTRFLEIGCFEGRATTWLIQNGLEPYGSSITCIDTFEGSVEHEHMNLTHLYQTFVGNVSEVIGVGQKYIAIPKMSYHGLADLIKQDAKFDFIYIDGSHTGYDTLTDACMAWPMLNKGGIMLFDDYLWTDIQGELNQPKIGVDAFLKVFAKQYEIIINNYQLGVRKI